jgi:hypothetical protein
MLGSDKMDFSTQVPIFRHSLAPMFMSYHARHLMPPFLKVSALVAPTQYRKPPSEAAGSLSDTDGIPIITMLEKYRQG